MIRLMLLMLLAGAISADAQELPANVRNVVGAPEGAPRSGASLDREADRVAGLLRCPVCQGLSVNDSPAEMAVNMKHQVRSMIAAGYSGDQVLRYFEESYGEYVRLEPKREGLNWLVWLAPAIALIAGVGVILRVMRRPSSSVQSTATPQIPDDLLPWVERVRAIAYGERDSAGG